MASSSLLIPPDQQYLFGNKTVSSNPIVNTSLVYDDYNKKYYGTMSYDDYVNKIKDRQVQAKAYVDQVTRQNGAGPGANPDSMYNAVRGIDPIAEAQKYLDSVMGIVIPDKASYVQSDDVVNSYKAYGNDWNTYFEGNYKNPRMAEENRIRNARGKQQYKQRANWYSSMQELEIQNSSFPSAKKARGTGVVAKADTFSGGLEAGLGV